MLFDLVVTYLKFVAFIVVVGSSMYATAVLACMLGTSERLARHLGKIRIAVVVSVLCSIAACVEVGEHHYPTGSPAAGALLLISLTVLSLVAQIAFLVGVNHTRQRLEQEKADRAAAAVFSARHDIF